MTKFARPVDTRCVRRRRCFGVLRWPPAPLDTVLMAAAMLLGLALVALAYVYAAVAAVAAQPAA